MIKQISDAERNLKRKEKVMALSRVARESAIASAVRSALPVKEFKKDAQGIPRPSNGVFWSVSHKEEMVAGVVSTQSVGIDLERIKSVSDALFNRVIAFDEAMLFEDQDRETVFFRVFTAKEAVLKKTGVGIKGLSKTKVSKVIDQQNLLVQHSDQKYWVENFYFDGYLAAVTKDRFDIKWIIE